MSFKGEGRAGKTVRRKRAKSTIIRTLDPRWTVYGEGGEGFFASLLDAFLPGRSHAPGNQSSSSSGPANTDGTTSLGEPEKPEPGLGMGTPILPAILFVGGLALLLVVFLTSGSKDSPLGPGRLTQPEASVWVMKNTGSFYCADSVIWGAQPGQIMRQGDALGMGYQPAIPGYCQGEAPETQAGSGRKISRQESEALRVRHRAAVATQPESSGSASSPRF